MLVRLKILIAQLITIKFFNQTAALVLTQEITTPIIILICICYE